MQNPIQSVRSLPSELTIYTVGELYLQCLAWLEQPLAEDDETLRVAADAVEEADAAGVQLLLSMANALAHRQRQLRLVEPSDVLCRACTSLGLATLVATAEPSEAVA